MNMNMNPASLLERKCLTDPKTTDIYRLLQWKPCWAIICLFRFKYDQNNKNSSNTILNIENCGMSVSLDHVAPILVAGHYIFPYRIALSKVFEDSSTTSDLIITDFIENSIISLFNEYLTSNGPALINESAHSSMFAQLYHTWNSQVSKLLIKPRSSQDKSREHLFEELEKMYAIISSLVDQRSLHLWSRPLPPTGERNMGRLVISEAVLFSHLMEAFMQESISELIVDKYPVLREFYDHVLKKYFHDFSWVEAKTSLRWAEENRVLATNPFIANDPKCSSFIESLVMPRLPAIAASLPAPSTKIDDIRYVPLDEVSTLHPIEITWKKSSALQFILSFFTEVASEDVQVEDPIASKDVTEVSVGGLIFSTVVVSALAIALLKPRSY